MFYILENIVPIITLVILIALGTYLGRKENASKHIGRAINLLCVGAVLSVGVFYAMILILFSSVRGSVYASIVAILGFLAFVSVAGALWGFIKKKYIYIPIIAIAVGCIVTAGGVMCYDIYVNSIPTVGENDELLKRYEPYSESSEIALLDGEAELVFEGDLPKLDGATALYPVYSAFANAVYPEELVLEDGSYNVWANEKVTCSTTTGAYHRIVTGEADIIFVGGPSQEQEEFAKEKGVELVYTPIGKEAFVFFVNSKNPIEDITLSQIQDIYSGSTVRWSELGVEGFGNIRAFQRDEGSGSQSALVKIMGEKELMTPPKEDVIGGMGGIISRAADYRNYKNAIGYSFRFYSTEMVKNNQIKLLSINGVEPTLENIENGTYPVASHFYAVTRADADENILKLLDWIVGEQGQELVEKTGYTPLG